jgi:ABC-2 type transport system ATP-binding protein
MGMRTRLLRALAAPAVLAVAAGVIVPARAAGPTVVDGVHRSFDGTPIAYTFFAPPGAGPDRRVPVVLMTHGWAGNRATEVGGTVKRLLDAGYAVLTWDQRGFGDSGGEANIDSQEFEVRDVRALIDWVARRPEVRLDGPGDPRMGMIGASYAGGIQLMVAAVDRRVDAIVPEIAWHSLTQSLKPNGVLKLGWGSVLYGAGALTGTALGLDSPAGPQTGVYAPEIHRAYAEGLTLNDWTTATFQWFDARSPAHYLAGVQAPTLVVQGVVDTLFPLDEGIANFAAIGHRGVPVKLIAYCGGHVIHAPGSPPCRPGARQGEVIWARELAWLDRWVKGAPVDTGPIVEFQIQDGTWLGTHALPTRRLVADGTGTLVHTAAPTSGSAANPTPAPEAASVRIPVAGTRAGDLAVGVPRAHLAVTGTGTEAYVFVKLLDVDTATGEAVVVDDQVRPVRFGFLSGVPQRRTIDLGGIAWQVRPGHRLVVELSTSSADHAVSRVPSVVRVSATVEVPVV